MASVSHANSDGFLLVFRHSVLRSPEMSEKKLCFLCKGRAKGGASLLDVQVNAAKNAQISLLDAMKNLTGIDVSGSVRVYVFTVDACGVCSRLFLMGHIREITVFYVLVFCVS